MYAIMLCRAGAIHRDRCDVNLHFPERAWAACAFACVRARHECVCVCAKYSHFKFRCDATAVECSGLMEGVCISMAKIIHFIVEYRCRIILNVAGKISRKTHMHTFVVVCV